MWELCNEVNYSGADPRVVRSWHADMAAYLHEIDPNGSSWKIRYDLHSSWYQRFIGKPVRAFENVCALLPVDTAARYRVQWWDAWRGGVISQADVVSRDGRLRLAPPRFERDIACKVWRLDGPT